MRNMLEKKKYKNCSLPYGVWGKEIKLYYSNFYLNNKKVLDCNTSLVEALNYNMCTEFYYSFNIKNNHHDCHDGHCENCSCSNEHEHAHAFNEVVEMLYLYPESFYLTEKDYECYSKQELAFLNRTKKYLLYVGRKDTDNITKELCENELADELLKCNIRFLDKNTIKNILNGKQKEIIEVIDPENPYLTDENKDLLMDNEYNIYGVINTKVKEKVSLKEFKKMDIDYKVHGFTSMDEFVNDIKNSEYYQKDYLISISDIISISKN